MTDRIALVLGIILAGLVAFDLFVDDGQVLLFLARKFFVFVEYLAFWR